MPFEEAQFLSTRQETRLLPNLSSLSTWQGQEKVCPCPHGKVTWNCAGCHGCAHGRVKFHCRLCYGCVHGRLKYHCKVCKQEKSCGVLRWRENLILTESLAAGL
ncbi:unnamed protein product [Durusdinium trenchii]|uniref:Uncharacterized protein n=1 Tax=Durusdinium trenchii TaxID=1381693 RepID=A0ABP0NY40_9DINO